MDPRYRSLAFQDRLQTIRKIRPSRRYDEAAEDDDDDDEEEDDGAAGASAAAAAAAASARGSYVCWLHGLAV